MLRRRKHTLGPIAFKDPKKLDWSDNGGHCMGYPRRYLFDMPFATQDKFARQYFFNASNMAAPPCSDRRGYPGTDETRAHPVRAGYGGQFGRMTVTKVGDTLCIRWPAKNHDPVPTKLKDGSIQISMSNSRNGKDISQTELFNNTIARLNFSHCMPGADEDHKPCGGCFEVPYRAPGTYLLQWRWMTDPTHWYTSCADVNISKS
ncbi:hypothetical protein BGZ46_007997 [Entomortierella lignicola]|nr:hypothetical protein BGZ46_007997 [Entomortierella lignicola]